MERRADKNVFSSNNFKSLNTQTDSSYLLYNTVHVVTVIIFLTIYGQNKG
jgi:hypothetical protein